VITYSIAANRLPFADQIIVLGPKGEVSEQGSWAEVSGTEGGYVSGCEIAPADWDFADLAYGTKGMSRELITCQPKEVHAVEALLDEKSSRQTGDIAVYKYYLGSIGWFPIATFVVAISSFVFCITFPSNINAALKHGRTANS
jgi:ATP-binding cassette, subfamily C (CFTR/MRP), member 1